MQPTPSRKQEQANRTKQAELDRLASLKPAAKPERGPDSVDADDKQDEDRKKLPRPDGPRSTYGDKPTMTYGDLPKEERKQTEDGC